MSIKNLPRHLRPREKIVDQGIEALTDTQLIAVLLRTGSRSLSAIHIAARLLKTYNLPQLMATDLASLRLIKGIDVSKACTLMAAFELGKRALGDPAHQTPQIDNPAQVVSHVSNLGGYKKEHFCVLYLNARHQLITQETISIGTLTASLVHPREVFAPALELRAASIILAHNHPSQDSSPSQEDIELTIRIAEAGELLGIEVLDHLVITKNGYSSLKQLSLF